MWRKNRFIKYFGVIGILGPILIYTYYVYIVSWLLGFAFFSVSGSVMTAAESQDSITAFLNGYRGILRNEWFSGIGWAYLFLVVTLGLNTWILLRGIRGGIELLCKIAMPVLLVLGVVLVVRVLTLGAPDPAQPAWNVGGGMGFLWNPDFSVLGRSQVWLAAAGQVFFSLSVGFGVILTYSSYLKRGDDVALSGLTAVSTNTFAEVILGGSIVIPAAFAFFGPMATQQIAQSGFDLAVVTMPMIFAKMHFGQLFAVLWFTLLFLAGITSSVSVAQPAVTFLEDELDVGKGTAVAIFATGTFILIQLPVFLLSHGVLDDMDFLAANFFVVVFALIEVVLFAWVFGMNRAWEEIHHGAQLRIPRVYKYIIKFVTPSILIVILGWWFYERWLDVLLLRKTLEGGEISPTDRPIILASRLLILLMIWGMIVMVKLAWRRRQAAPAVSQAGETPT
ncbi:MAG: sodium:calcium symporter [Phycisphaerae bacterium]|nr:sodium:calcium symporter [Phycisphaerae bacterium]